jgi:hypothetical protein
MTDYVAILEKFVYRGRQGSFALDKPFTSGAWTGATSGAVACCVPSTLFKVDTVGNTPDIALVLSKAQPLPRPITIPASALRVDEFEKILDELGPEPTEPEAVFTECDACSGTGVCFCECAGVHSCGQCEEGKAETSDSRHARRQYTELIQPWRLRLGEMQVVQIGSSYVNYKWIRLIREAIELAGIEQLTITSLGEMEIMTMIAGDFTFVVMPLRLDSSPDPTVRVIDLEQLADPMKNTCASDNAKQHQTQ